MHPVDPPSLDYVPSPKEPEQALLSPDYVPGPDYPEYLAPSDDELLVEDQPHDVDALPIALSPGYIVDSDPEGVQRRHKNWLVHKQTTCGKDFSNPFMVDNLPKIVGFSTHLASLVKSWLVQDQTVLGKDYSNLLIADSLLKTIWFINAPCYGNEALASPKANELTIPEQTATGKGTSNPFMADKVADQDGKIIKDQVQDVLEYDIVLTGSHNEFLDHFVEKLSNKFSIKDLGTLHYFLGVEVNKDDPNITIEEYIRLKEEKACRHGKVYNWETATCGRIWDDDEVHNLRSVETEFPDIVFDDMFTSQEALSCEPTVSPLNDNEIDFRISFDEFDDEDYTVIFDKNSFSYKIISIDDLKTDSENDNDKVNMPSFPSPEPTVSYFDDLDYLKDFKKEFPAIVYNDALTSKLDFLTEPAISPQHIDEFDLKDETSLFEHDEEEQNILYFNDLFPFNIIYQNDLKLGEDNDDKKLISNNLGGMYLSLRYPKR
ncbi:aldehyde dehydrogenase family 3 member F1-like protein [Tanacetum coccineum]